MMDPKQKLSKYFTYGEALYLPSWRAFHEPSAEELANVTKMAAKMDEVREVLNCPVHVHVWIRPVLNNSTSPKNGLDYNDFVKGARQSMHKVGLAVDFSPVGMTVLEAKKVLIGHLDMLGVRMEDNGDSAGWIHLDLKDVPSGGKRFFKP